MRQVHRPIPARRVLFNQATEPVEYPPLIQVSILTAKEGWETTLLSTPIECKRLQLSRQPAIPYIRPKLINAGRLRI